MARWQLDKLGKAFRGVADSAKAAAKSTEYVDDVIDAPVAVSRGLGRGLLGAAEKLGSWPIAAGVGAAVVGSNIIEGDEETYGMQQALLEGVLGDPYADVAITGKRVNLFGAAFNPLENILPGNIPNEGIRALQVARNNPVAMENWQAATNVGKYQHRKDDGPSSGNVFTFPNAGSKLRSTVMDAVAFGGEGRGGYSYQPINTTLGTSAYNPRYVNRAQHDPRLGDIVFGAYNTRHGR